MEIIEELEPTRRGLYGGTVGYFGFGGDLDMAIAIRTALIRDGRAYVQAGRGDRRRLGPGRRGAGDPQQGRGRARRHRRRRDAAAGPMTPPSRADQRAGRPTTAAVDAGDERHGGRRELTYAVLLCLAGAGLALWAATRTWAVELTVRPAPLPPVRDTRTGAGCCPGCRRWPWSGWPAAARCWPPAGRLRRRWWAAAAVLGAAVAAGGGYGLVAGLDGEASRQWPALCLLGGVLVAVAGGLTDGAAGAPGRRWAPGTNGGRGRAERPTRPGRPATRSPVGTPPQAWDALDRGEDPTRCRLTRRRG